MLGLPPGIDLCQFPAALPPSGAPNFYDPPSLGPALIAVTAVMVAWTCVFLASRLWVNRHRLKLADGCAIMAFAICLAYSGLILAMERYMRHQYDIPACWFNATYVQWTCVMQILMPLSHSFSKISILLLLLQIFSVYKKMKIAIYVGILLVILDYGPNLVLGPLYTIPYAGETWDDLLTNGRPQQLNKVGLEQAILAVIVDLYIFLLPFPILSSLKIGSHKRLQLGLVFGTGMMGVIASAIGLAFRVALQTTDDATWIQGKIFICIMVEIYIAIIVSCLPALANLVKMQISESRFYKFVVSFLPSSENSGRWPSLKSWRPRSTIGGTKHPEAAKNQEDSIPYFGFHDTALLNTNSTLTPSKEASIGAKEAEQMHIEPETAQAAQEKTRSADHVV